MKQNNHRQSIVLALLFAGMIFAHSASAATMKASVDATDITRGLLKASTEYRVSSGVFELYYPQWIPGIHGPKGPIENLAEISVSIRNGKRIDWQRDPHDVYKFLIHVPRGVRRIIVDTTYICNQPNRNSRGIDSYGSPLLGIINWNTVLLYPAKPKASDTQVELQLSIPEGWKWGSSLKQEEAEKGTIGFETLSYEDLVDSPLIMGKHFKTYDITPEDAPPHFMHTVSESEKAIKLDDAKVDVMKRTMCEGMTLFGTSHFESYHLLVVLSDSIPGIGLEHLQSSLNATGENGFQGDGPISGVFAHEYGHSWCGKYRRPAGMITPNFNTPKDTALLWVYEGLETYIGHLLESRSGSNAAKDQTPYDASLKRFARKINGLMNQKGRRSVSLEDTSASGYLRRGHSRFWGKLNRPQDYYDEGALFWLEADLTIRTLTEGEKSLDDFIQSFLGHTVKDQIIVGFDEAEVIQCLNEVAPYDWAAFIDDRIRGINEHLPLDVVEKCGFRIQYSNKSTKFDSDGVYTSLGITTGGDGRIHVIIPGSPADRAGLFEGAVIMGVNNLKFTKKRLEDALADSVAKRKIDILLLNGEKIEEKTIDYADGPKYLDLVRNEDNPDLLKSIWEPIADKDNK